MTHFIYNPNTPFPLHTHAHTQTQTQTRTQADTNAHTLVYRLFWYCLSYTGNSAGCY